MNPQTQSAAKWKDGAWSAALTTALGLLFLPHPLGQGLADWSYDLPFRVRPKVEVNEAMILYMDDASHKALDQPSGHAAWDRSVHARLLRRLTECRARAVVFDILFDETSTNDAPFLDAIKAATNAGTLVVVGGKIETHGRTDKFQNQALLQPFEALQQVAAWGLAEHGDEDQILRSHFRGAEGYRGAGRLPSLAWRVAELTLPALPCDPALPRWINYYGPPGTIPHRSYHEALDPRLVPAAALSNQVCFVGALPPPTPFSGSVRSDLWRTPYSRWTSGRAAGVEINATVYANLVRQDWLRRLAWPAELLVVIAAGVLLGLGFALTRPTRAVGAGLIGMLSVAVLACWLTWRSGIWFSWLIVAGVQIPAAIGMAVLSNARRLDREKSLLEIQLAEAATALQAAAAAPGPELVTKVGAADGAASVAAARPADGGGPPLIPDHTMIRCVGKGAYGEVWLARNVIGTYHAVKVVKRVDFESDEPYEREFRGIQKFMPISRSHPGLVQILHAGRNDTAGHLYYIMEAGDDETTGARINPEAYTARNLARDIKKRRHLPAEECLRLSLDLTAALDFLHRQQLIHRDIKPSNIIFVQGAPKFADIGLVTDIATRGHDATYLGTKGYIAPEGPGTPAADVYSLGKVLYEASMGLECGQYPELPSTLLQRSDSADLFRLNEIILKACHSDPAARYQSAAEMHADLARLQNRPNT